MTLVYSIRHSGLAVLLVLVLVTTSRAETLRERRERVERMTAAEKEELQRKEKRFRSLSEGEQQRLQAMHEQLANAADGEELSAVMERYYAWLKTLQQGQRAEILSLPPEERLDRIRKILEKQARERFERFARTKLEDSDVPVIKQWVEGFIDQHQQELLDSLPERMREEIERNPNPQAKRGMLMGALIRGEGNVQRVSSDELEQLTSKLSPAASEMLKLETDADRRAIVLRSWVEAAFFANFRRRDPVPQDELMRFLQEDVSPRERAELEELPAEHFRREAERLYYQNQWRKRMEQMRSQGGPPPFPGFGSRPIPDRGAVNRPPPENGEDQK